MLFKVIIACLCEFNYTGLELIIQLIVQVDMSKTHTGYDYLVLDYLNLHQMFRKTR